MIALLSEEERQHSEALAELMRARIAAAGGWLSFDNFMELALYAPGLGYYSAGAVKLGAGGDFLTAPEMSRLFAQCLARQCAQVLAVTGGGVLEFGAGSGAMAATVLEALAELGALPDQYAILEVSADLAARQRARMDELPPATLGTLYFGTTSKSGPVTEVVASKAKVVKDTEAISMEELLAANVGHAVRLTCAFGSEARSFEGKLLGERYGRERR